MDILRVDFSHPKFYNSFYNSTKSHFSNQRNYRAVGKYLSKKLQTLLALYLIMFIHGCRYMTSIRLLKVIFLRFEFFYQNNIYRSNSPPFIGLLVNFCSFKTLKVKFK